MNLPLEDFTCYYCEHLKETQEHDYNGQRFDLGSHTVLSLCKLCYQAIGYHYLSLPAYHYYPSSSTIYDREKLLNLVKGIK